MMDPAPYPQSLAALYTQDVGKLTGWFRRRVSSLEAAEDLVADTFVRAARYWDRYQEMGAGPSAWLKTIARSILIDYYRHQALQPEQALLRESDAAPGAGLVLDGLRSESLDPAITAALQQLPERQARVVLLRFVADQSILETARRLDVEPDTVKKLSQRGLGNLRRLLVDWSPYPSPGGGIDALISEALLARRVRTTRRRG